MPRLTPKKAVRKKPASAAVKPVAKRTATKKSVRRISSQTVAVRSKKPAPQQAIAADGVPWPPIYRTRRRGNLTAKQIREAVQRAMAAVEADRLAQNETAP